MRKMTVSEKAEKSVYAALAMATFFLAWAFITTFTAARETTPGPVQVIRLLFTSFLSQSDAIPYMGICITACGVCWWGIRWRRYPALWWAFPWEPPVTRKQSSSLCLN